MHPEIDGYLTWTGCCAPVCNKPVMHTWYSFREDGSVGKSRRTCRSLRLSTKLRQMLDQIHLKKNYQLWCHNQIEGYWYFWYWEIPTLFSLIDSDRTDTGTDGTCTDTGKTGIGTAGTTDGTGISTEYTGSTSTDDMLSKSYLIFTDIDLESTDTGTMVLALVMMILMILALLLMVLTALALILMILVQSYLIFTDGFWGYLMNLSLMNQSLTEQYRL